MLMSLHMTILEQLLTPNFLLQLSWVQLVYSSSPLCSFVCLSGGGETRWSMPQHAFINCLCWDTPQLTMWQATCVWQHVLNTSRRRLPVSQTCSQRASHYMLSSDIFYTLSFYDQLSVSFYNILRSFLPAIIIKLIKTYSVQILTFLSVCKGKSPSLSRRRSWLKWNCILGDVIKLIVLFLNDKAD